MNVDVVIDTEAADEVGLEQRVAAAQPLVPAALAGFVDWPAIPVDV